MRLASLDAQSLCSRAEVWRRQRDFISSSHQRRTLPCYHNIKIKRLHRPFSLAASINSLKASASGQTLGAMPVTRSRASQAGQAPATATAHTSAAAESTTSSQLANRNSIAQASDSSKKSSKRAKADGHNEAPPQPDEASPCMLPIELLVDIFGYLNTSEVGKAAQVSKVWGTASADVRLWRHISFSKISGSRLPSADADLPPLSERLRSIGARSGNKVESVDFGTTTWRYTRDLAEGLIASAPSLKHICWSSEPGTAESLRAVATLARCSPQLETLELRSRSPFRFEELFSSIPSVAKPRRFRFIFPHSSVPLDTLRGNHATLLDHATSLEFCLSQPQRGHGNCYSLSAFTLARLLQNPAIEKLTVHGLYPGTGNYSISAPSLTRLDLRWSVGTFEFLSAIDAPELRELAIDARFLSKFTHRSMSALSSLTLRIVASDYHGFDYQHGVTDLRAIDRVKDHQGILKLTVDSEYTESVLRLLSEGFLWPGLEECEIELSQHTIGTVISIIAARQAGAHGASEEEYLDTLRDVSSRLFNDQPRRFTRALKDAFEREAQDILAAASAFQLDASAKLLCSKVQWKIGVPDCIPCDVVNWLEEQSNIIQVQRL